MKLFLFLLCILISNNNINALSNINVEANNCGNGIICSHLQTCMSNLTGAGLAYACSPLTNAVRCMDARFSCPYSSICAEQSKCIYSNGSVGDAVVNLDAFHTEDMRDFGSGMKSTSLSICGSIVNNFRLPNFCTCSDARFGGNLDCTIGLLNFVSIGASAWVLPCAIPANFGYRAWATLLGMSQSVGRTWRASFTANVPIPGTRFDIGIANAGASVELSGVIEQLIISTQLSIGVCAKIGIGFFSKEICNPSTLTWLPVTILRGPRFDFSRLCRS
jgi:hypothetical protein